MYPEDLVVQLNTLQGRYLIDKSGEAKLGNLENAPVKRYRSTLTGKRQRIREELQRFLRRRAKDPSSCVWQTGAGEWSIYGSDPVYGLTEKMILLVLTGKGTVQEIRNVLKVVSLMLQERCPNPDLDNCTGLRKFVDDHVGHDCNGLIFSYLRTAHGYQATEDKKCYQYREKTRARTSTDDVQELDMVFPSNGKHILIIGRIWDRTSDSFECNISESRDPVLGGPQYHHYRVKRKDGEWELKFRDRMEHPRAMGVISPSSLIA